MSSKKYTRYINDTASSKAFGKTGGSKAIRLAALERKKSYKALIAELKGAEAKAVAADKKAIIKAKAAEKKHKAKQRDAARKARAAVKKRTKKTPRKVHSLAGQNHPVAQIPPELPQAPTAV